MNKEKNNQLEAPGSKIMMLAGCLIMLIFLINGVSAFEFDNVKKYTPETKTVQVENAFGLGATIGEAQLLTPQHVRNLFAGYQNVSMIKITGNEDYTDFIKNIKSYDKKDNLKEQTRTYDLKYLTTEAQPVDDYTCSNKIVNGSSYNICEITGSHLENKSVWKDLSEIKIKKNQELIIGLFTDVKEGELVEWVPTIFGTTVDEWADFGSATRKEYYNPATTLANTFNAPTWWEGQSFTIGTTGANQTFNLTGIIAELEGTTDAGVLVYNSSGGVPTGTPISTGNTGTLGARGKYNISMASTELLIAGQKYVYMLYNPTSMKTYENQSGSTYSGGVEIECSANGTSCSETAGRDEWFELWGTTSNTPATATLNQPSNSSTVTNSLVVFNITGSDDTTLQNLSLIVNGTYISTNSSPINNTKTSFSYSLPTTGFYNWSAEACDNTDSCTNTSIFYITLTNNVAVTLNQPVDSSTVFSPNVLFNITGTDDTSLQNLSLIVNGSYISTNSSPINNTKTGFSYTLPSKGLYNWSGEACDNTDTCANASVFSLWYNTSIAVALNQPANAYLSSSSSILFNATASDDTQVQNISFILNGTYNGTNTSVYNNTLTQFLRNIPDGFWNWTVEACDNLGTCVNATSRNISVDTTIPAVNITDPIVMHDVLNLGGSAPLNWTATDSALSYCWYQYNGVNTTVTCNANTTNIVLVAGVTNVTFWANDTSGNNASDNKNFYYKVFEMSRVGGAATFETATTSFSVNTTSNASLTGATLNYNGTAYTATKTGNNFSVSLQVPVGVINQPYYWDYAYAGTYVQSNTTNQSVALTFFANCNVTYTNDFLNLSFQDESSLANINATVPSSTFVYYIGNGTINKTLTYSNASQNVNYTFCATPTTEAINIVPTFAYAQLPTYPQRTWSQAAQAFNSTVFNKVLNLLSISTGQYVTIQVVSPSNSPLEGVAVNVTTSSGLLYDTTTDAAGSVTFFLDPSVSTVFGFSFTGYDTQILTIFPTQAAYTVTMGVTSTATTYDYYHGINYTINPTSSSLINDTVYTFNFSLNSSYWAVTSFGFNLVNSSGSILNTSVVNANSGTASVTYNTTNLSQIYMNYFWIINSTTTNATRTWVIYNSDNTAFSITSFFTDLTSFMNAGMFGLDNFGLALISFLIIFIGTGIMSYNFGFTNPATVAGTMFFITLFLNVGLSLSIIPNGLSPFSFFPSVAMGLIFIGILMWEVSRYG